MNSESHALAESPKTFFSGFHEKLASLPASRKKALEYVGLFVVLTAIYYCYFVRDAATNAGSADAEMTLSQAGALMLKFFVFTGWPFALLAFSDSTWRGKDAGNVFLASYIATNALWYFKAGCGVCIFATWFRIIPYILCACLAHGVGALRYWAQSEE
jgi:hypothetical protein